MKRYIVETTGLSGRCSYVADNPDDAAHKALKHECLLTAMELGSILGKKWFEVRDTDECRRRVYDRFNLVQIVLDCAT